MFAYFFVGGGGVILFCFGVFLQQCSPFPTKVEVFTVESCIQKARCEGITVHMTNSFIFVLYNINVATNRHCNSCFTIFSLLVWLPYVHCFYPVCKKWFCPPWLLTVNSKPAETDLGSEMCECIFQFSELTPLQGLAASAGINFGTLSLHADVQVFHNLHLWWTIFAVFVIEHLDLFFSRLRLRGSANQICVSVFSKRNGWIFI